MLLIGGESSAEGKNFRIELDASQSTTAAQTRIHFFLRFLITSSLHIGTLTRTGPSNDNKSLNMSAERASKLVPGAPPPAPVTKSQKRKQRKGAGKGEDIPSTPASASVPLPDAHSAALTEQAPTEADMQKGVVAEELLAHDKEKPSGAKPSPIVDLLNKRLKSVGKKIVSLLLRSQQLPA